MFEKYKESDLITIKLASGEELIGKLKTIETDYISLEQVLVLMQGPQGLAMGTFFSTADQKKPIDIFKSKVTSIANLNDKIETEYNRVFSKVIKPTTPKIIV